MPDPSRRSALFVCAALAALAAGCDSGKLGDMPSQPIKDEFGHGQCVEDPTGVHCRLCDILGPARWEVIPPKHMAANSCNLPPNEAVIVSGVTVVAIDRFDETHDGKSAGDIYLEDTNCGGMPYSGIETFNAGFSPPNLRLAEGDVVDMNGVHEEFVGPSVGYFDDCHTLPEFTGTIIFRFDSIGVPKPVVITNQDIVGYDNARPFLGMLVTLENVTLGAAGANSSGRYTAPMVVGATTVGDTPLIDNELYDLQNEGPPMTAGAQFKSVTGILTFFYEFHISPRSPADFVPMDQPDAGAGSSTSSTSSTSTTSTTSSSGGTGGAGGGSSGLDGGTDGGPDGGM